MYVLGFDIGGTKCAVVTAEVDGGSIKLLKKEKCPTDLSIPPEKMIEKLIKMADSILDGRPDAIGISCGGPLDSKKGIDIKVLRVDDKTVIAEYFVLCTGNSSTQIRGLAGEVEFRIGERGLSPYGVEGRDNNSWLILDYSNVIVHIFSRESREFYNLDKLYAE